jgi:hypothetical protein
MKKTLEGTQIKQLKKADSLCLAGDLSSRDGGHAGGCM